MKRLSATVLEQIINRIDHAVVVVDAKKDDKPIVYVNRTFERMTGFVADEVVGQDCGILHGEATDGDVLSEFDDAMEDEQAYSAPLVHYRKDGSEFSSHLKILPLHSRSGRLTHWLWCLAENGPVERQDDGLSEEPLINIDLDEIVAHDRLTGIHSRKFFEAMLDRRWQEASDEQGALSLFMIEIDAFSEYMDTFGRQAGDSCLRLVARAITGALRRASDLGARYGKEEFAALVCDLDADDALKLAKRIRDRVAALCIHHPRSGIAKYVSVSIGVASLEPDSNIKSRTKPEQLLADASAALDLAKEAGRNTVKKASNG